MMGRSVPAFLAESEIADALGEIQNQFDDLSLGSYPFMRDGRYGTSLVIRGTDAARIDAALRLVVAAIKTAGGTPGEIEDA